MHTAKVRAKAESALKHKAWIQMKRYWSRSLGPVEVDDFWEFRWFNEAGP